MTEVALETKKNLPSAKSELHTGSKQRLKAADLSSLII